MYCVKYGKYGLEIYSCANGIPWDEAVRELIKSNK